MRALSRRPHLSGVTLTARQRDYLATYPDEVSVVVVTSSEPGAVFVYAYEDARENGYVHIPPGGFPGQPRVELHDAD